MFLLEEYLVRHGVTSVPVINYPASAHLYLRHSADTPAIRSVHIWTDDSDVGPPVYVFDEGFPAHNCTHNLNGFFHVSRRTRLQWDEYEPFVLDWAKALREPLQAADAQADVYRAAVSAFAVCFDRFLRERADAETKDAVYGIISGDPCPARRQPFAAYLNANDTLRTAFQTAFHRPAHYAHWLARLVNDRREPWVRDYALAG